MEPNALVAVHGIGNLQRGCTPEQAAAVLAADWQTRLADGYRAAGLGAEPVPALTVAYYAHLLTAADLEAQGPGDEDPERLSEPEAELCAAWLRALGAPEGTDAQGRATMPFRQALHWLSARHGVAAELLGRVGVALAREVSVYLTHPPRRRAARDRVAETIRRVRPRVVLAHSLGSVVTYEALHAHPDLEVPLLITLGSPLGLSGGLFEALDPAPRQGRGSRPPGVGRWVNLADRGDLVAVPRRLGDRFPVDEHDETSIGRLDFHTLGSYLASGRTVTALRG
ncbi:hypothetical protein ABH931_003689 [Streptacidiphilus sp. MAP12-33]|uniref:serine peptidase n=1 Tax=Streptacidiphilus sp. MAP12-33 TaxID=3156266 RepID=UPI003515F843